MTWHTLDLSTFTPKPIRPFDIVDAGNATGPDGVIGFTNHFMTVDGKPAFGVCAECHYARLDPMRWDAELAKMAAGGVTIVSTYIFWIHHEEVEGEWDFTGRRDLRHFIELCGRHGLKVIVRLGPFCHGEVRNGGLPDWLYGKPYEARSVAPGFMDKVWELYSHIAEQLEGLYHKDGGPIIAAQLENEYQHSSSPWEMTTGISDEWVPTGGDGIEYIEKLRAIAVDCGIDVPFLTSTGWGGSPSPEDVLPLWGGYAYRPWLFFQPWQRHEGGHPLTDEYLYRNYRDNDCPRGEEFDPSYQPEDRPYACCEMGGGMFSSYNYRFQLPMKSVDAMTNIKIASGCNFVGYYMYHGGTNPLGRGVYLNEGQTPKLSYDFQAPLGEFGQERESYRRLRTLHRFCLDFADQLCPLDVALPGDQQGVEPSDAASLRWCVRTDGKRGFVFLNNFQDHAVMDAKHGESIELRLNDGSTVTFDGIGLFDGENCVLPFNLDLDGITLEAATAQPIAAIRIPGAGHRTFVFMRPEGMGDCWLRFASDARCSDSGTNMHRMGVGERESFTVACGDKVADIVMVSRAESDRMTVVDGEALVFADGTVFVDGEDGRTLLVESERPDACIELLPEGYATTERHIAVTHRAAQPTVREISPTRYAITIPEEALESADDARLRIDYSGDIGWLFCGGTLINDNFANGAVWEIGLLENAEAIRDNGCELTLVITPVREGANVNVESAMAARSENVAQTTAELKSVTLAALNTTVLNRA